MWSLTRQERILLFSLAAVLGIGTSLVMLKRSFGLDLLGFQPQSRRIELKDSRHDLLVFVKGAVQDAGVYRVPPGSRVIEAVQKARPLPDADLASLPLADFVRDGQTLVVARSSGPPERIEGVEAASTPVLEKINVNTADVIALDSLPGVGPEIAVRMIAYRRAHRFTAVEDLLKVSGIGQKKFEAMRERVRVE